MGITRRGLIAVATGVLAALAGLFVAPAALPFLLYNVLVALLFLIDYLLTPGRRRISAERVEGVRIEQGRPSEISVRVTNAAGRAVSLSAVDPLPESFVRLETPGPLRLEARGSAVASASLRPMLRGDFSSERLHCEAVGVLGFVTRRFRVPLTESVRVYPDLAPLRKARLSTEMRLLDRDSAARHRTHGIGTDFRDIREYNPGDDIRKINWKASAAQHRLMSNVYDIERDQNVVAVIDTGRTMISPAGEKNRLDHSVEAALALIQAALSSGDRAGLLTYGRTVGRYIPPGRGQKQVGLILDNLYNLTPDYYESDISGAVSYLLSRQKRRSLVVVFTFLSDDVCAEELLRSVGPLARRHVVLICSIRNPGLLELTRAELASSKDVYIRAAAIHRVDGQAAASTRLRRGGVYSFAAEPEKLPTGTINSYLDLKKKLRV